MEPNTPALHQPTTPLQFGSGSGRSQSCEEDIEAIESAREAGPFVSLMDFCIACDAP